MPIVSGGDCGFQLSKDTLTVSSSRSWADMVVCSLPSQKVSMKFFPPSSVGGWLTVRPPASVVVDGSERWEYTLVGYFIGCVSYVEAVVKRMWGNSRLMQVSDGLDWFIRFSVC
ncbi:hypothetical protein Nepgr_005178 [Nepenthes gracilis]|uniref:Uncharacterized protein n=1 Tax=Nepenthes gracilis TaxID=150966 RepID=A0AAD3S357_NEPGR|nr:hypothetical protein Nepgr_005178 [Nepenthes gracilis]